MNIRHGLFRFWIVFACLFVIAVGVASSYPNRREFEKAGEAKAKAITIAGTIATKYPQSDYAARAATLVYQLQESIPIYGTDRQ